MTPAASACAHLMVGARRRGSARSVVDGQIAAIARDHKLTLATRDAWPFEAAGLSVVDYWNLSVPNT